MTRLFRHTAKPKNSVSLLIQLVILCEIVKQTNAVPSVQDLEPIENSSIPDFLVSSSGLITAHPLIENTIKKPITYIDPRLQNKLTPIDQKDALFSCDEAIYEILKENSWLTKNQFLHDIDTNALKIILTPPEASHDQSSIGSYSIKHQHILISYKSGFSKEDYKIALLNELMSHSIVMMHKRCGIVAKKDSFQALPFLNKDGDN